MAKTSISDECLDMETPLNEYLTATYKRSFAYHTVRNRLPVTVTQVIDHLSRSKDTLTNTYGAAVREEIKQIAGYLSKLKNEMQTNKPLIHFTANDEDQMLWNEFLQKTEATKGRPLLWFADVWLHIECYLYRRIREAFALTQLLHDYDPFRNQKEDAFSGSLPAISVVGKYLLQLTESSDFVDAQKTVLQFLKLSLWGNRCDLSISGGKDIFQVDNPLEMISQLDDLILANDTEKVWKVLSSPSSVSTIVDIIFDNSGYELFTDLCLAHILMKFKLATHIRFHAKRIPWFISDVMKHDFNWLLEEMAKNSTIPCLPDLASQWKGYLNSGCWSLHVDSFWTLPYSYDEMRQVNAKLYSTFQESKLLIFKGDLNYRKLVGDVNWPHSEKFSVALRGFEPAPVVTLRTIKADTVVGLAQGQAEEVAKIDADWMTIGKYAVVSCSC